MSPTAREGEVIAIITQIGLKSSNSGLLTESKLTRIGSVVSTHLTLSSWSRPPRDVLEEKFGSLLTKAYKCVNSLSQYETTY